MMASSVMRFLFMSYGLNCLRRHGAAGMIEGFKGLSELYRQGHAVGPGIADPQDLLIRFIALFHCIIGDVLDYSIDAPFAAGAVEPQGGIVEEIGLLYAITCAVFYIEGQIEPRLMLHVNVRRQYAVAPDLEIMIIACRH